MWIKSRMEAHHMFRTHPPKFNHPTYKDFKQAVIAPVKQDRSSGVRPESSQRFSARYDFYKDKNEATFKREMLNLIVKDEFQILIKEADGESGAVYESYDTFDNGLVSEYEQPLRREYMPHQYGGLGLTKNQIAAKLQADGMTNPVPDALWGFKSSVLPPLPPGVILGTETAELVSVIPGIEWTQFLIEVKPDGGSMETARNQACRGGATLVHAARRVLKKTGRTEAVGPDWDTYVYSVTMDADLMEWWVNWAEVREDGQVMFYMDYIQAVVFRDEHALQKMRGPIHNILQWALLTRLPNVIERYPAIYDAERTAMLAKGAKAQTTGEDTNRKSPVKATSQAQGKKRERADSGS
ncbi:hypothetical protein BDR22DRAFT_242361 [Usnea florida]